MCAIPRVTEPVPRPFPENILPPPLGGCHRPRAGPLPIPRNATLVRAGSVTEGRSAQGSVFRPLPETLWFDERSEIDVGGRRRGIRPLKCLLRSHQDSNNASNNEARRDRMGGGGDSRQNNNNKDWTDKTRGKVEDDDIFLSCKCCRDVWCPPGASAAPPPSSRNTFLKLSCFN